MTSLKLKLIAIMLGAVSYTWAQLSLSSFVESGVTPSESSHYLKNIYRTSYTYHDYLIDGGFQLDLHSNNPRFVSAFDLGLSKQVTLLQQPLNIKGYGIISRFSELQYESNYGISANSTLREHLLVELGFDFKTYHINKSARESYNISREDSKLRENFILCYNFSAYLKPISHDWNVSLACTNTDYYVINRATNPVFNLQGKYTVKSSLSLYLEAWYKQAGIFNIQANYYGYFFRGGITWDI